MKQLTPKERFTRCAFGQDIDVLPVQCDFTARGLKRFLQSKGLDRVSDLELLPFFENHVLYAYMNGAVLRMKTMDYQGERILHDEWGCGWDTTQDLLYCESPLKEWDDLDRYHFPDPEAPGYLDYTESLIKSGYAETHIVSAYHFCTLFERAYILRGFENLLMDLMAEEALACGLLDRITDFHVALAKRYVRTGVNCGRTVDDYGMQTGMLMAPDLWRRLFKPRLARIHAVYHEAGLPVIHHSCGNITEIVPDLIEIGVNVLNPIQPKALDLKQLGDSYGDRITFFGGICNQEVLPHGTPEQIDAKVKEITALLGRHGRFVIAPSNGVGSDVPLENIDAYCKAALKYRVIH
ncbi:uroporphyrinogen III decarboxylase [Spirochaetia bacterium]|nr:uroporphyrinogen III decarboxylase [Spirochaetia bacterium]